MEPHDINAPVSGETPASATPKADDQITQPNSSAKPSAKPAPCGVKPECGAPGDAATTIPQVSLDELNESSRSGFWIPSKQTTLGLQLNKTSHAPSAPLIQDDADRRAFSERVAAQNVSPNWTEVEGVVELAIRPALGLTLPGLPGVNVGFAAESLLQYRSLHPYPARACATAAPAPASPEVKLPTSAAAALKMPRGSELELRGRGTIKGSLGVGIGHGTAGPLRVGVGVNAGVTQKFTGDLSIRVKRLGDSLVRVDITDIDSASTNLSAQVTAGLSLDNSLRNLGEGVIISAVRNGAPEELETILNIVVNANINARLAYETGVENREISAVVLDLTKPEAREAYNQLVALDTTLADELAEQSQSGVWFAQAHDVENTAQFDASVSMLGTKLLLFHALDQARSGVFEGADGTKLTYHDASYEQETVNVVSGDKKITWQGVSLEDPATSSPTEAYFRLKFSATDKITYQDEVDSIFRFAKALKLDTSKGDSQLEAGNFAEKLWEDGDDTQVDIDLYFTPAGIKKIDTASTSESIVAAVMALQDLDPEYEGIPFGYRDIGEYAIQASLDYIREQESQTVWKYLTSNKSARMVKEYKAKTKRDLGIDAEALGCAIEMAQWIRQLKATGDSQNLSAFFSALGQSKGFEYQFAIATLANLAGEDDTLIHQFALKGKEVSFEASDEGVLKEVTPTRLMKRVRRDKAA
jgi:hypothetical protein